MRTRARKIYLAVLFAALSSCLTVAAQDPFSVSPISGHTNENGLTATITITANRAPLAGKTLFVNAWSTDTTEGEVSPNFISFTAENWSQPQAFVITGVDDFDPDQNVSYEIGLEGSEAGTEYLQIYPMSPVPVINDDNDTVIYVDRNATGANNGSYWHDAFIDPQQAFDSADPSHQIWIATGIYVPTSWPTPTGNSLRDQHFALP